MLSTDRSIPSGLLGALVATVALLVVGLVAVVVLVFAFADLTDWVFGRATLRADFAVLSAVVLVTGAILGGVLLARE